MKLHLTLAFALLLVCTGAGAALAQTPDDLPPALETVCDAETGAAYGFCNAYCEAMDCDSDAPNASANACSQVRGKFQNITGRDVPCALACPCTSLPEFNADLEGMTFCLEGAVGGLAFGQEGVLGFSAVEPNPSPICGFVHPPAVVVLPITPEEAAFCLQVVLDAAASNGVTCN